MNSFKQYLHEQQHDALVYAFGRYNPPSRGHILHFQAVRDLAIKLGMPYELFISKTVDHKKNPVSVENRIAYIQKALPVIHSLVPAVNMFTIVDTLAEHGKKRIVYVAGSDYFEAEAKNEQAMMTRLQSYAKEKGMELTVQMSRQREALGEVSGTALRQAALNNDFKTFLQASPVGMGRITEQDVARMFELTKRGMAAPARAKKKPVV